MLGREEGPSMLLEDVLCLKLKGLCIKKGKYD